MGSKESKVERRLISGVKSIGGMTFKFISPGAAGVPDRVVILPGGTVHFVELKADGGVPSKLQLRRIKQLRRLDVTAVVIQGRIEVEHYLDNLRELMNE